MRAIRTLTPHRSIGDIFQSAQLPTLSPMR